jgi:hypothetical protein
MPIATNKKTYQIFLLASTLLSRFLIMYWKLGGHENMIVLLGLKHVKQTLRMTQIAASSLTYTRSAAVVSLRIVTPPLEVGSETGSIVMKRDNK